MYHPNGNPIDRLARLASNGIVWSSQGSKRNKQTRQVNKAGCKEVLRRGGGSSSPGAQVLHRGLPGTRKSQDGFSGRLFRTAICRNCNRRPFPKGPIAPPPRLQIQCHRFINLYVHDITSVSGRQVRISFYLKRIQQTQTRLSDRSFPMRSRRGLCRVTYPPHDNEMSAFYTTLNEFRLT